MFWSKKKAAKALVKQIINSGDNKNVLLPTLKSVINSLEKNIIHYDWQFQGSCNCGLVVQGLLDVDEKRCQKIFEVARSESGLKATSSGGRTWKEVAQNSCSVTGMPLKEVFKVLENKGFKIEDVVHLEYLDNPAILQLSGINVYKDYWEKKENLILYLKSWVKILEGNYKETNLTTKAVWEARLLVAVNAENYEEATKIRNQLAIM